MPAPNLYQGENAKTLFTGLPPELMGSQMDLLYVTDRQPENDEEGNFGYGAGRSRSLAYGSAVVNILPEMDWKELERASVARDREPDLELQLISIEEQGRFAETPSPVVVIDGQARPDPEAMEASRVARSAFREEILRRLALAPRPEVLIFVHGFNNTFEYAALTLAETWHFMGREFVPILYTWPAGMGGASGYIYDRESGEFTVHHLKNILSELASIPEIESFHLVAHSRGTDVLSSAIRELSLVARAAGTPDPETFRDSHIVLAAPDLDMDVVSQRIIAEEIGKEVLNLTVYTSQTDKAISLAEQFFKSPTRLGRVNVQNLTPEVLALVENMEGISFVDLQDIDTKGVGHAYFHSDPAAVSDLILTVRYGREPGEENGRPLKPVTANFWQIEPGYPHFGRTED
jgi:esterase/lipase superfamily enzyme